MKIVLATFGSRGDVQPMLALALALKTAGHDVLLAGPPEKAAWVQQMGCPFCAFGSDLTAFIDCMPDAHSYHSFFKFMGYIRNELMGQFATLPKIIENADLVVGASLVLALPTVAESLGIPYRYIAFTPQLLPSGDHPFPAFKRHGLPKWYNRMTWQIARLVDRFDLTRLINKKRKQLGLDPVENAVKHILDRNAIVASDKVIARVPTDVDREVIQTGYMHLDQPDQNRKDLEAFLNSGSPPVYAGFGSMPKQDQIRNLPVIVEAARLTGQRVMIGKFWDEPSEFSQSDDVFFVQKYPHLKLFPRMAAVIHHGGAGTTASCAISGVPQIIIPHVLDQYYWGHRVYRNRLGTKPISRSKLSCQRLASAMRDCLSNHQLRKRAQEAAETIRRENSLDLTVGEILKTSA